MLEIVREIEGDDGSGWSIVTLRTRDTGQRDKDATVSKFFVVREQGVSQALVAAFPLTPSICVEDANLFCFLPVADVGLKFIRKTLECC